jgi:hypothetical protein
VDVLDALENIGATPRMSCREMQSLECARLSRRVATDGEEPRGGAGDNGPQARHASKAWAIGGSKNESRALRVRALLDAVSSQNERRLRVDGRGVCVLSLIAGCHRTIRDAHEMFCLKRKEE